MLTQLIMNRAAHGHTQFNMQRHADLRCALGSWRQNIAAASHWVRQQLGSTAAKP